LSDPKDRLVWKVSGVPAEELSISFLGDPVRVVIVGEVDLVTREQFEAALAQTFGDNGDTVLDLGGVSFMDTHAVTAVVRCSDRLFKEGGRLVIDRPPASLRRIFELLWGGDGGARLCISGERGEP
jgi:anti-anti-sigma factor